MEASKMIEEAEAERAAILDALEYAPHARSRNPELAGMWTKSHLYICAECSARLLGRGCGHFLREPVYKDQVRGVCVGCEPWRDSNGDCGAHETRPEGSR